MKRPIAPRMSQATQGKFQKSRAVIPGRHLIGLESLPAGSAAPKVTKARLTSEASFKELDLNPENPVILSSKQIYLRCIPATRSAALAISFARSAGLSTFALPHSDIIHLMISYGTASGR